MEGGRKAAIRSLLSKYTVGGGASDAAGDASSSAAALELARETEQLLLWLVRQHRQLSAVEPHAVALRARVHRHVASAVSRSAGS